MILRYRLFLLSFLSVQLIAFDVKVLLEKFDHSDSQPLLCKIASQHGLQIAGIDEVLQGPVTIACCTQGYTINGSLLTDSLIQISPVLSKNHEKQIDAFITQWFKDQHEFCTKEFASLDLFYEKFVLDTDFKNYAPLYEVLHQCIQSAISKFIAGVDHPAISYESLSQLAKAQLHVQLKTLLITGIEEKHLSKTQTKQLRQQSKARIDFFSKVLHQVLALFLKDYFVNLPHKIIQQAMKEETGCLMYAQHKYLGTLSLLREKDTMLLINTLDIDDYLLSVVHSEGWPGWPMEVNKALVVASRTYLVDKILAANKAKRPYHIVNSIKHQTYKGHHKFTQLKQAVDDTRNIFIAYNGKPIDAMFDSCCGGVIPANIAGIDSKKHPYLARSKPCTYCKKCWIYSWKKEFSRLELTEFLRKDHSNLSEVKDIKVTEKDAAGLVVQVLVTTAKKSFYVSGKKMYSLFPAIKSFCYSIKKRGKNYLFMGKGYGHHKGLCQWGSLGMVQDNWNYKSILQFYYPGTEFMTLALSR